MWNKSFRENSLICIHTWCRQCNDGKRLTMNCKRKLKENFQETTQCVKISGMLSIQIIENLQIVTRDWNAYLFLGSHVWRKRKVPFTSCIQLRMKIPIHKRMLKSNPKFSGNTNSWVDELIWRFITSSKLQPCTDNFHQYFW